MYIITLFADWLTIFLDPTYLDFSSKYYALVVVLALITTFLFQQFDTLVIFCTLPYIFWLIFMCIFCHLLHDANHDGWWFFNEDNFSSENVTNFRH